MSRLIGRIIKGIGGLYFVSASVDDCDRVFECSARGIFKNINQSLLIGDIVEIKLLTENTGHIEHVLERKNELIRPFVSNIDRVILVMSAKSPAINTDLLNKYLLTAEALRFKSGFNFDIVICISKYDLKSDKTDELINFYRQACYTVFTASVSNGLGVDEFGEQLRDRLSVLAGPSGVGKSSLVNCFVDEKVKTGSLSVKIERGKHTTRHTELINLPSISPQTFIIDSPGFSSISDDVLSSVPIDRLFREFAPFLGECRFSDCKHLNEPGCAVKEQIGNSISQERYSLYESFMK